MPTALTSISGIGPAAAETLKQHGFESAEAIANTSAEKLSQVPGFGPVRAENTIKTAIELTGSVQSEVSEVSEKQTISKPAKEKKKSKKDKKGKGKGKKNKKSKDKKKDKKSGKDKKDKKKDKKKK